MTLPTQDWESPLLALAYEANRSYVSDAAFNCQEELLNQAYAHENLVAVAWADARAHYNIPQRYAEQLINGVARDLHRSRYEMFEALTNYCYGVASTVGLMSMHIIGFYTKDAIQYAVKLGVALQMINR